MRFFTILTKWPLQLLLIGAVSGYACSSKKSSGDSDGAASGTKKTVKDGADDEDDDDDDDDDNDPCAEASLADDDEDSDEDDENCGEGPEEDPWRPSGELYAPILTPPAMEQCHVVGKIYERDDQACHATATYPAAFNCDRAGVLAAFSNHPDVVAEVDRREAAKFLYDQCGVLNAKPYVAFVCFTTPDQDCNASPVCKPLAELDVEAVKVCTGAISVGG